ncbi:class I SAM-dependent methyltransferase [Actinoplanes sp. NPDC049596]|uniref:class I SAM-dependent methyltransferase n=1 Tax=unclassified Actinoplanes TaxID=2626549 RepID=UPI00344421AE
MTDADGFFGEDVAETYDIPNDAQFQPEVIAETVDVLADLAGGGRALEFAIGTGRVAVPLARRGVEVHGIDMSRAMLARLGPKPGAEKIGVTVGDFTTTRVEGEFDLVYLVFNTIMNVTTQQGQVAAFRNAAAHLRPGGRFLVEVMVPELRKLPPGQTAVPFTVTPARLGFDTYEPATQAMSSVHVVDGRVSSIPFRYVWPAELDLMAQLAGMTPEHRWESWARTPFGNESNSHISTWILPQL